MAYGKNAVHRRRKIFAWVFLTPMLIYYSILTLVPLVGVIIFSFTSWAGVRFSDVKWVGLKNYIDFFTIKEYSKLFLNTLGIGFLIMSLSIIIGFFIAQMMTSKIKGKAFFRTIWYIPTVVSLAVTSELVGTLLNPNSGMLNLMISSMGGNAIIWQTSTFWMFFWIISVSVWKGLGGTIILFMAALTSVPPELYEAADVDGANKFQKLIHVTFPCIRQMFAFILITGSIGVFSIYEQVLLISKGGPMGTTKVIMYQIYDEAFLNLRVGMSSAIAVIVLIIVMIVTMLNFKLTKIKV